MVLVRLHPLVHQAEIGLPVSFESEAFLDYYRYVPHGCAIVFLIGILYAAVGFRRWMQRWGFWELKKDVDEEME